MAIAGLSWLCASWRDQRQKQAKSVKMFSRPRSALHCYMALDESLLPGPQIPPPCSSSDPRGVNDSVIFISRLPAPLGCSMNCLRKAPKIAAK